MKAWPTHRVLNTSLVAMLSLSFMGQSPQQQPPFAGLYRCTGTIPDGTRYQLQLSVSPVAGANPRLSIWQWTTAAGLLSAFGVGLTVESTVVAVSFAAVVGATAVGPGIVVYKRRGRGLIGTYAGYGDGALHEERCEPGPLVPAVRAGGV